MKKRVIITIMTLLLCFCARKDDKVVARVDGSTLTAREIDLQIPPEYRRMMTANDIDNFINSWAENEMFYLEAKKQGIDKEDSVQLLIKIYTKRILAEALKMREFSKITITEDEVRKYFDQHKDEFLYAIKVSQIILPTIHEAQTTLEEIKAGADFMKLARAKSLVRERNPNGVTDYFTRGDYIPDIEEKVFALKVGEVSDVIPTPEGVFIIVKVLDRKKIRENINYYDVKDYIQNRVLEITRKREVLNALSKQLKTVYKLEIHPELFPK